jgi:dTDP-4-amino-4,6-dideoxy-D-galactose acyltransferase
MSKSFSLYDILDWDSKFFGVKIARWLPNRFCENEAPVALEQCHKDAVECIYCLIQGNDHDSIRCAEKYGLSLVDIRLTLSVQVKGVLFDSRRDCETRVVMPADLPQLRAISANSHEQSRFYSDTNFSRSLCSLFYQTWITKSCEGRSDRVIVAIVDDIVAGYVTCERDGKSKGNIGLLAVAENMRGRGIGRQLILDAFAWFQQVGVEKVAVVTQGTNCKSQRVYQAVGFRSETMELWYHWWPSHEEAQGVMGSRGSRRR